MHKKMKKKMTGRRAAACLCVFLTAALCAGCGSRSNAVKNHEEDLPVITVGCDNYSPFSYMDVDGDLTGVDVDLATEAFHRMGYEPKFEFINWEDKKELLEDGSIDCIWSCFTMDGREEEYRWAGPYMMSHQVVAVGEDSEIQTFQDLKDKTVAVQSTTKPEDIFRSKDPRIPELRRVISVQKRDLIFVMLSKGYVDAIAAHDTSVDQFMEESGMKFRILEEPLLAARLGVAFDKNDERGIPEELTETLRRMQQDGTTERIIGKYFENTERYLGELNED